VGKDSRRIVRVTLQSGMELEIHDDEIYQAFQELDEQSQAYAGIARVLLDVVTASIPVLEYVSRGDKHVRSTRAPDATARQVLGAARDILDKLKDETDG